MNKLFSWFLCVFLFCGLSGLAWAAAQTSDRTQAPESSRAPDRDVDRGALLATDLTAQGILVAGLFDKNKKSHCWEVYVKTFVGKEKRGTAWAVDCKEAQEAIGLDIVLKQGATCTKTKAKSGDECY